METYAFTTLVIQLLTILMLMLVGWRNNKSGEWEIYQENDIINPTNNFDIIVFKPGYGSIIKSFN